MTTKGSVMNAISPLLPRAISNPIWNSLSRGFAEGAAGEASVWTTQAGPPAASIWLNVEKPILMKNLVQITQYVIP